MARILVVEDNPTNLELMIYLLQAFGYEALSAMDGEAGLELANRASPDLIICDIGLPKMDGYAVAAQLKGHPALKLIPLLAVTALAMVGDRDKVLASGFDGYIPKPIDPEAFVRQVEKFLPSGHPSPSLPAPNPQASHKKKSGTRATILAVDNSPANLYLIQSILEPADYRVITALHVNEAIALAKQSPPDLIMSDLHMPGQSGFDLIRAIRADPGLQKVFILIHSATTASESEGKRALDLGANCFICGPIEPSRLPTQIEECLARRDNSPVE